MKLPGEYLSRVAAPPGMIYVERDKAGGLQSELIVIPDHLRDRKRSALATVRFSSSHLYLGGERVILAPGVSRAIEFADKESTKLYLCHPGEVAAIIVGGLPATVTTSKLFDPIDMSYTESLERKEVDEGDRR